MREHLTDTGIPKCLNPRTVTLMGEGDFSRFISQVYGRPYQLQQQRECLSQNSLVEFTVPAEESECSGPSLAQWQATPPPTRGDSREQVRWKREFFPQLEDVVNDLHTRGLLPAGEYALDVSW
ncbi:hypothetical protein AB0C34_17415 [Nocardia sp. NPDC049220]|uniref:hypothetical protein n=1 Tax=Nocardia sp. NPDC049220 TaxID=3155273 RepID=UPI0033DD0EC9